MSYSLNCLLPGFEGGFYMNV